MILHRRVHTNSLLSIQIDKYENLNSENDEMTLTNRVHIFGKEQNSGSKIVFFVCLFKSQFETVISYFIYTFNSLAVFCGFEV